MDPEVEAEAVDLQFAAGDPEEVEHLVQGAQTAAARGPVQNGPLAGPVTHDLSGQGGEKGAVSAPRSESEVI